MNNSSILLLVSCWAIKNSVPSDIFGCISHTAILCLEHGRPLTVIKDDIGSYRENEYQIAKVISSLQQSLPGAYAALHKPNKMASIYRDDGQKLQEIPPTSFDNHSIVYVGCVRTNNEAHLRTLFGTNRKIPYISGFNSGKCFSAIAYRRFAESVIESASIG